MHIGPRGVWTASSENLTDWGAHRPLIMPRDGTFDGGKTGASCVPIKTEAGWLEIYHGSDENDKYSLAAALLDLNEPSKIIARSKEPLLGPEDAIISDQLNHASIIDGIRLCKAKRFRYAHLDMDDLEEVIQREKIKIVILTVPAAAAQVVADRLVKAGIIGIFNFAPTDLKVPEGVAVRNERLAVGIMSLSFKVKCILQAREGSEANAEEL